KRDRCGIGIAAESVGERRPGHDFDKPARLHALVKRARGFHLDADHAALGRHCPHDGSHAADEPSAADAGDDRVHVGASSRISSAMVPAPAMTSASLYGEMNEAPVSTPNAIAIFSASS